MIKGGLVWNSEIERTGNILFSHDGINVVRLQLQPVVRRSRLKLIVKNMKCIVQANENWLVSEYDFLTQT